MALRKKVGVAPELRAEIAMRDKAMSGDLVLKCTPATLGNSAAAVNAVIGGAAQKYTRDVVVTLVDAKGNVHTWFDGTFGVAASKVGAGATVAIAGGASTVALVAGRGVVTIEYTGSWAESNSATLTVTGGTKLGYTIANKTSVDTLIA